MNTWGTSGAVKRKMVHVSVDICNITQNRNTFRKRNTDHIDQRRSNWNIECRRLCQIRRSCRNKISRRIDPDIIPFFQETIKRRKMVFFYKNFITPLAQKQLISKASCYIRAS